MNAFQLLMMLVFFDLIAPLFHKYTPLVEGELYDEIQILCKKVNYSLRKVYTVDGSKRSSHSNAYFFGMCCMKRLVLYDTLIEKDGKKNDVQDIMGIVGHEISHWKYSHTWKLFVIQNVVMLAMFYLFQLFVGNPHLFAAFGFVGDSKPVLIGLLLFSKIFGPVDQILDVFLHMVSRKFEYEADEGAILLGYDIEQALIKIFMQNQMSIHEDWLYSAYKNTHPSLLERLDHIQTVKRRRKQE